MRRGDMMPLGDQMKRTFTLKKCIDFSGLNIVENIWDNLSSQFNKILVFRHFYAEKLHIIALKKNKYFVVVPLLY